MKIATGADMRNPVTDAILAWLRAHGHDVVEVLGPMGGGDERWADVGFGVARAVADGRADQGIACCWTGTGVSIAANKVPGIRAALCTDAEQARGARKWNDANVLAMGLRLTSEALAEEILAAWFEQTDLDPEELEDIAKIARA